MEFDRRRLYRFPWSRTDNPGGWVEVTDLCDLRCPGCYRHSLEGHRPLEDVCSDILACRDLTGCDRIGIAGGEPLLYPHLIDVVEFIARRGMKPMLLTNGERLTSETARELKRAGVAKFHIHVDAGMNRPGWEGRTETEMNELRQRFADLLWDLGGVQCGFNITVFPSSLSFLPDVVSWCRRNIHKIQHVSLVAFRAIPLGDGLEFRAGSRRIDPLVFQHSTSDPNKIGLTSQSMLRVIAAELPDFRPAAYLEGTAFPETFKFLVTVQVGTRDAFYGLLGPRTMEMTQVFHHLFMGRYFDFLRRADCGRKLFLLSLVDQEILRAFGRFLLDSAKRPLRFFHKIYAQSVSLQQPNEIIVGEVNLCNGCPNAMTYRGRLIPSCRLDEYRMFGEAVIPLKGEVASPAGAAGSLDGRR